VSVEFSSSNASDTASIRARITASAGSSWSSYSNTVTRTGTADIVGSLGSDIDFVGININSCYCKFN